MFRKLVTMTAGLSLVLTLAAPAQAFDNTQSNALSLLLGAATIGLILNDAKKGTSDNRRYGDDQRYHAGRNHRVLPLQCAFPLSDRKGRRSDVLSERCLAGYGLDRRLPQSCAFDIRDRRGRLTVYDAKCLTRSGYKIASLRR
ncbi:MAG: hypothetical protein KDE03_04635 [Rhodobacteraceae bacterium]|nr:hypothetical protein [Paracoccaceae bacterium]